MDDLYLVRQGNTQFQCQPDMVEHFYQAGYDIYRYEVVKMTKKEIEAVAKEQRELYAIN